MADSLHRTGILLVNLGTPDAPEPGPVRRYLREFLSDPRVIDINPIGRALLLHLVILPFRPRRSAAAYQKIWTPEGSPLLIHGRGLLAALRERMPAYPIELAMRYGNPSIPTALARLREHSCDRLIVLPLYPQYASSSTGSSLELVYRSAARLWNTPYIQVIPPFYDHPAFLAAFAEVARPTLDRLAPDHLLFSFHGLPERQVIASADPKHCLAGADCCERLIDGNRNCYRAQCFATARGLASALGLGETHGSWFHARGTGLSWFHPRGTSLLEQRWSISFQSRLGRTPWIKPYTDEVIPALASRGVRKLAVMCPAFVADCLETLEEIGMRAREDFVAAGGERLELVPSLNVHPRWVAAVEQLLDEALPQK